MNDLNTGYKIIAAVSLTAALFSCGTPGNSNVSNREVLEKLDILDAQITEMRAETQAAKAAECSTEKFLNGNCADEQLPDDVAAYTTFCISQGRGLDLGAEYAVNLDYGIEVGGGWPEAVHVELTPQVSFPVPVAAPFFPPPPTTISAGGAFGIGRGIDTCVDLPIELTGPQVTKLREAVKGANDGGKFSGRVGRVVNYAERRAGGVGAKPQAKGYSKFQPRYNEDDAFEIAESAVDRFLNGEFASLQNNEIGLNLFSDPIFLDLATSLELPEPMLDLINDPLNRLGGLIPVPSGDSGLSSFCVDNGLNAEVRGRFDAIESLCDNLEKLPKFDTVTKAFKRIQNLPTQQEIADVVCAKLPLSSRRNCD